MFFCADIAKTTPKVGFPGSPEAKDFVYFRHTVIESPNIPGHHCIIAGYYASSVDGVVRQGASITFRIPHDCISDDLNKIVIVGKKFLASPLGQAGVFAKKVATKTSQQVPAAALIVRLATNTCEIDIR